ncbi:unnamed protein product [Urochloa decumbens]|uniref:OPA3-like protein n=1 Tax=Urochloa decumbens TaxID=240449 RepID=A0ABC9CSL5_9POAL
MDRVGLAKDMAAAARYALVRSVATRLARRPGSGPEGLSSRRFNSSPAGASTPPPTNKIKDATENKTDLREWQRAKATLKNVTKGVVEFLAFGSVIYMFVMVKPEVEGLREDFDALERTISKVEEEIIRGNCSPMERQVEARDGIPNFSVLQPTQSSASSSK